MSVLRTVTVGDTGEVAATSTSQTFSVALLIDNAFTPPPPPREPAAADVLIFLDTRRLAMNLIATDYDEGGWGRCGVGAVGGSLGARKATSQICPLSFLTCANMCGGFVRAEIHEARVVFRCPLIEEFSWLSSCATVRY